MTTYKKTQLDSPMGLFVAKETIDDEGVFHLFKKGGNTPLFTYRVQSNRLVYIGGISEISPEGLQDCAKLCMQIFDNDK